MARTFQVEIKMDGAVVETETREATIETRRVRSGAVDFLAVSMPKDHFAAFIAAAKSAGAKFTPGPKAWTLPADKAGAFADTLRGDGFYVAGFLATVEE